MATTKAEFNGITIHQPHDQAPLSDIYPVFPVQNLTADQEAALDRATRAALVPLVEAAWREYGVTVRWTPETDVLRVAAGAEHAHEDVLADLTGDLRDLEGVVWGDAYDNLDEIAVWTAMIAASDYEATYRHPPLKPGTRVRHHGEQYTRAHQSGTAEVVYPFTINGHLEYRVLRDHALYPGGGRLTDWSDERTYTVGAEA